MAASRGIAAWLIGQRDDTAPRRGVNVGGTDQCEKKGCGVKLHGGCLLGDVAQGEVLLMQPHGCLHAYS